MLSDYYPPPSRRGTRLSRAGFLVTDLSSDLAVIADPTLLRIALRHSSQQDHLVTVAGWSLVPAYNKPSNHPNPPTAKSGSYKVTGIETYGMKRFDGAMTYVVQVRDAPYLVYVDARSYIVRGVAGYSCGTFVSPCGLHHPRYAWSMKLVRERTLPLCAVPRSDRAQILHFEPHAQVCTGRG